MMNVLGLGMSCYLAVAMLGTEAASTAMSPPADAALARYAPEECLFYASWASLIKDEPVSTERRHEVLKTSNQTEQLLAEPEIQDAVWRFRNSVEDSLRKLLYQVPKKDKDDERAKKEQEPVKKGVRKDFAAAVRTILGHPTAIFGSIPRFKTPVKHRLRLDDKKAGKPVQGLLPEDEDVDWEFGFVVDLGRDAPWIKAAWHEYFKQYCAERNAKKPAAGPAKTPLISQTILALDIQETRIAGQTWYRFQAEAKGPANIWGFCGDYFVWSYDSRSVEKMLARQSHQPPKWWSSIAEMAPIERRVCATYVNVRAFVDLCAQIVEPADFKEFSTGFEFLGIVNVKSYMVASGLDRDLDATKAILTMEGAPRGPFQPASERPLRLEDLATIPRDASFAAAFRLDLRKVRDGLNWSAKNLAGDQSDSYKKAKESLDQLDQLLGGELQDTLGLVGDTWCLYSSPSECPLVLTGGPLRNRETLVQRVSHLKSRFLSEVMADPGLKLSQFRFGGQDIFCLDDPNIAPAWCLTGRHLVCAVTPLGLKSYLIRNEREGSLRDVPEVAACFASGTPPTAIIYYDAKRLLEGCNPMAEFFAPIFVSSLRTAWGTVDSSSLPSIGSLPSSLSITRHMRPGLITVARTKHGLEIVGRGSLPMPSGGVLLDLIAWSIGATMGVFGEITDGEITDGSALVPATPKAATPKAAAPKAKEISKPATDRPKLEEAPRFVPGKPLSSRERRPTPSTGYGSPGPAASSNPAASDRTSSNEAKGSSSVVAGTVKKSDGKKPTASSDDNKVGK